jgi:hypothetical protein
MILIENSDKDRLKVYSGQTQTQTKGKVNDAVVVAANEDFIYYVAADAAVGHKNNDDIIRCRTCVENGFPNEAIMFETIPSRILADGTNEVKSYCVLNYADNSQHEHKDKDLLKDLGPKLWQQAMESV